MIILGILGKNSKPMWKHTLFWSVAAILLMLTFGLSYGNYVNSFYFVTFLLPVAIGTSTSAEVYKILGLHPLHNHNFSLSGDAGDYPLLCNYCQLQLQ